MPHLKAIYVPARLCERHEKSPAGDVAQVGHHEVSHRSDEEQFAREVRHLPEEVIRHGGDSAGAEAGANRIENGAGEVEPALEHQREEGEVGSVSDEGGAKAAGHGDGRLQVGLASPHEHNEDQRGQEGCGGGRRTRPAGM